MNGISTLEFGKKYSDTVLEQIFGYNICLTYFFTTKD